MRFLISWFAVSLAITAAGVYGKEKYLQKDCKLSGKDLGQPSTSYKLVTFPDRASLILVYKDKFEIILDVQHFDIELKVNTVDDQLVVGTKYKKKHGGKGAKQWVRIYKLPAGPKPVKYDISLSSNGMTISVPRPKGQATGEKDLIMTITGTSEMDPKGKSKAKPKKTKYLIFRDEESDDSIVQIYEKCGYLSFAGLPCSDK